jgi:hypothetical protein
MSHLGVSGPRRHSADQGSGAIGVALVREPDAAVKLTTKAFAELKSDPEIGRAEALRRSMVQLISNGQPHEAHPATWTPFVLVGEGSR